MTIEERIAEYKRKIAVCDAEERESTNPRTMAAALIYAGIGIAVASLTAHQSIGVTLGIIGVIAGIVWRSDLNAKSLQRSRDCNAHRAALKSLTSDADAHFRTGNLS
jgi:hypothetical protein